MLLDPALIDPAIGWRLAFLIGARSALVIFVMRMWIPESPRWLVIARPRGGGATRSSRGIEARFVDARRRI